MRIAIANHGIFPEVTGGMERHTYNLAKSLKDRGHDVHVLVPVPKRATFPFPTHHLLWPPKPIWLWGNYEFSRSVGRWLAHERPDIALGQGFNLWGFLKDSRRKFPCVFHPHGLEMYGDHLRGFEKLQAVPFQALVRYHGKNSDRTISLGGKLTGILTDRARISRDRIVEIPNAVELADYPAVRPKKKKNSFVWVGRLAFNKGLDLLAEALHLIPNVDFELTIYGDGPYRHIAEQIQAEDRRVRYVPKRSDAELKAAMASAEALLFTSRFEGMPTVILEAMASHCGVVATKIGAVETMVTEKTGILVGPSAADIAKGISLWLDHTQEMKTSAGSEGRKRVEEKFSWAQVVVEFERLFDSLLTQGRK